MRGQSRERLGATIFSDMRTAAQNRRVCLFTGASGLLGSAFLRLYRAQYDIVAVYRSRSPSAPTQESWLVDPLHPEAAVPENENSVFAIQGDLLDDHDCKRVVELALARFGAIDLLVHAAATFNRQTIVGTDRLMENFDLQFRLNVRSPLLLSATVAELFWRNRPEENAARNRHIVHVASIGGVHFYPGTGLSVYSASKAALVQLSRHMASEFSAFGVRVNALAPSAFPRLIPVDRVASSLRELDQGRENGRVLILEKDRESFV
jgi:NAD(P)-dependent dehydrogenase (short-subunit alcohol dehydrogenase family)